MRRVMSRYRIAAPVWNGRLSPVFDTAQRLQVVDVEDGEVAARAEERLPDRDWARRAARLKELGVNELLCGAISRPLAGMISASGVTVTPFLAGPVDEVIAARLAGQLPAPQFMMPGCRCLGRGGRRRRLGRRGFGRGRWSR